MNGLSADLQGFSSMLDYLMERLARNKHRSVLYVRAMQMPVSSVVGILIIMQNGIS
jgi:hypothetical protein